MCCAYLERALWYAWNICSQARLSPQEDQQIWWTAKVSSHLSFPSSHFPTTSTFTLSWLFFFGNQHSYFVSSCCCIPHNSSRWLLSDKTPLHLRSPHQLGDICAVSTSELWYIQLLWSLLYKLFCGYTFRSVLGKYLGMGGLPQIAALTH